MGMPKNSNNSPLNLALIVGAVLVWSIGGIYVYVEGYKAFMPADAASVEAEAIDNLFRFMMGIGTFIFLMVQTLAFGFLFRFGFFRDRQDTSDGIPLHGNTTIEIVWTLIPAIIVFVLTIYSFQVLLDTTNAEENELAIDVVGQRFFWQFTYPNANPEDDFEITSNHILVLPEDESIRLNLHTADVMHAFWVPAFRVKQDLLPGRVTELRFTTDQVSGLPPDIELVTLEDLNPPGPETTCPIEQETTTDETASESETEASETDATETEAVEAPPVDYSTGFDIVCAELCGANHGLMRGEVFVVSKSEYDAYLESLRARVIANQAEQAFAIRCGGAKVLEQGRRLVGADGYNCISCHQITDAGQTASGQGPSLDNVAENAASRSESSPEDYIHTSIVAPNAFIVPNYPASLMPQNFGDQMSAEELDLIVAYLILQSEQ